MKFSSSRFRRPLLAIFCVTLLCATTAHAVNHNPATQPDEQKKSTDVTLVNPSFISSETELTAKIEIDGGTESDLLKYGGPFTLEIFNKIDNTAVTFTAVSTESGGASIDSSGSVTITDPGSLSPFVFTIDATSDCGCEIYFKLSGLSDPATSGSASVDSDPVTLSAPDPESNSSVNSYYNLGLTANGGNAGSLTVYANRPSADIYRPTGLSLVVTDSSVEVIRTGSPAVIRQILSATQLTDVVVIDDQSYELRFYEASKKGTKAGGVYAPIGSPFKTSRIENPGAIPIDGTTDDALYADSRWARKFSYKLPMADGPYKVALHFAELYQDATGAAVFNVAAEGQTVLSNYDVLAAAGSKNTAHLTEVVTTVRDAEFNLSFSTVTYGAQLAALKIVRDGEVAIAGTTDDTLYQSERTGDFSYALPLSNGTYEVVLHFSESTYNASGKRIFDVTAEGTAALDNYDIHAQAGAANTARTETIPVTLTDGQLDLQFTGVTGGSSVSAIKVIDTLTGTVVAAINAGGPAFTDSAGTVFTTDVNYTGGEGWYPGRFVEAINCGGESYTAGDGTVFAADHDYDAGYAYQGTLTRVRVTRTEGGAAKAYEYHWFTEPATGAFGECVLTHPDNLKKEGKSVVYSQDRQSYVETRTIRDEQENLVAKTAKTYESFPFGFRWVSEVIDPDGAAITATWTYIEGSENPADPKPPGHGLAKSFTRHDGYWEDYFYDSEDRLSKTVSRYLNSTTHAENDNRVETHAYATTNPVRTHITAIKGQEVSRTYEAEFDDGDEFERWSITAVAPGAAWHDAGNLVSKTRTYKSAHSNSLLCGQIKWTRSSDGTATLYTYAISGTDRIVTRDTGAPNTGLTAITAGTRTVTTTNIKRQTTAEEIIDIASGLTMSSWEALEIDELGRPTLIGYGDGTTRSITYVGSSAACGTCTSPGTYLIASETDRNGVTTSYVYDALNRRTETTRLGVTEKVVYDAADRVVERLRIGTSGPAISRQKTTYDLAGRVTAVEDALGNVTTIAYSYPTGGGLMTTTTFPATAAGSGTRIETTYADGRTQEISGTAVSPLKYAHGTHANGEWTQEIRIGDNAAETEWAKTYTDLVRRTVKMEYADSAEATMEYNLVGQLVKQTDPDGVQTLFAYNVEGRREITALDMDKDGVIDYTGTDRITKTTADVYDRSGTIVRRSTTQVWATDNTNTATTVSVSEQDGYGNQSWQTDAAGAESSTAIDRTTAGAWEVTATAPDGSQQVQTYTGGRLVSTTHKNSSAGQVTKMDYDYDAHGRVLTQTAARTGDTGYTYTDRDEVLAVSANNGTETTAYTYDALGNQLTITRPDSSVTTNEYHLRNNQLKKTYGSLTYPVEYTYDLQGRMKTLTTWQNATSSTGAALTTWNYDSPRGWLTQKLYDDGKGPAYTYTDAGRLLTRTWARTISSAALVTTYGYNAAGDLSSTDYSDTTADVAITYTRFGAQHTVTDATGTRTSTYNAALRPDQEQLPSFYGSRILTRTYQVAASTSEPTSVPGRNNGFTLGVSGNLDSDYSVTYGYDIAGRLKTVTDANGGYTYGYLPNSRLREQVIGPVHTVTTAYEPHRDVLASIENKAGTTVVSNYAYTVNKLGQRTARANTGTAFGTASTDVFSYNDKGEMTGSTNATLSSRNQSFVYDDIGNRLTFTQTSGTTSYTANNLNAYTAIGAASPTHDADGNQTSTGIGQTYIWDAENRLLAIEPVIPTTGDKKQLNTYDALSRRVRKQVSTYASGTWSLTTDEKFVYDGWNVVAVLDAASSNALLRTYTWGTDLSGSLQGAGGVGGLLSAKDGSSVYHYTYDANGNVGEVLNSSGGIAAHYEYDAFGNTIASSGTYASTNAYRFSTKPLDEVSELYYYGFRYYNPSTGRWPSRDPIMEAGGLNLYGFIANDLINRSDYLGQGVWEAITRGAVQAATAVLVAAAVSAYVVGAPLTVTATLIIAGTAAVAGVIAGYQQDGILNATGSGIGYGTLQGLTLGMGYAVGVTPQITSLTATQLTLANVSVNVINANATVYFSDARGNMEAYAIANGLALVSVASGGLPTDSVRGATTTLLVNVNIDIAVTVTCEASAAASN